MSRSKKAKLKAQQLHQVPKSCSSVTSKAKQPKQTQQTLKSTATVRKKAKAKAFRSQQASKPKSNPKSLGTGVNKYPTGPPKRRKALSILDPASQVNCQSESQPSKVFQASQSENTSTLQSQSASAFVGDLLLQALELESRLYSNPKGLEANPQASSGYMTEANTAVPHTTGKTDTRPHIEAGSAPSSKEEREITRKTKWLAARAAAKASPTAPSKNPRKLSRPEKRAKKIEREQLKLQTSKDMDSSRETNHQNSSQEHIPRRNPPRAAANSSPIPQQQPSSAVIDPQNSSDSPHHSMQSPLPLFGAQMPQWFPPPHGSIQFPANPYFPWSSGGFPQWNQSFQGGPAGAFFPGPADFGNTLTANFSTSSGAARNFQSVQPAAGHQRNKLSVLPVPKPLSEYLQLSSRKPVKLEKPQHVLLVMDLNGTLVHRPRRETTKMVARPHCTEFLEFIFQKFSVMVWSSAKAPNVDIMCGKTFTSDQERQLLAKWSRDHLRIPRQYFDQNVQVYKHLTWIWDFERSKIYHPDHASGKRWDATNTILLDDSVLKASSEPYNLIEVSEFNGQNTPEDETILEQIMDYLEEIRSFDNVAACIRCVPFKFDPEWKDPNT